MISVANGVMRVSGSLTMDTAAATAQAGEDALTSQEISQIDFSDVSVADSSGIAVVFSWNRLALTKGIVLGFVNLPASLISLAQVYDVEPLLALA